MIHNHTTQHTHSYQTQYKIIQQVIQAHTHTIRNHIQKLYTLTHKPSKIIENNTKT